MGAKIRKKEKGRKRCRKNKESEGELLREKGEPKKRRGGEPTKKRGEKKRKEGRKKRREEKRRFKEFDVDRTIKPEPIDLKFCYNILLNTKNHWMVSDRNFNHRIFVDHKLFLEILKSVLALVSSR